MSKHIEVAQLLELASDTAKEAGELLLKHAERLKHVNFQDATDVKLQADIESEQCIRHRLSATGWPIIGEEEGGDASLPEGNIPYWVVDPLDGTYNYLRSIPSCCVSIGFMQGLEPLMGVIYDFNHDDLYAAIPGKGFWINGEVVAPQWPDSYDEASLLTGFPAGMDYSVESLGGFLKQIQQFKKIRMLGSAAMAIAHVASGQADVYCEEGIRLWDVSAGLAMIKAAGASVWMEPYPQKPFAYKVWVAGREKWLPKD